MNTHGNGLAFNRTPEGTYVVTTPEGGRVSFSSSDERDAFIERRERVTWTKSFRHDGLSDDPVARVLAGNLLSFAITAHLFPDRSGNCSVRGQKPHTLVVTPRHVPKASLHARNLVSVRYYPDEHTLLYAGTTKASIDASVQATLYAELPAIKGLLHVHPNAGIFLPDGMTTFPYPCGTQEEAHEVLRVVRDTQKQESAFLLELVHHGYLLGLPEEDLFRLPHEWSQAFFAYLEHLAEIGHEEAYRRLVIQPIMAGAHVVGILATEPVERWSSCFLLPSAREQHIGSRILPALATRGIPIRAHRLCHVAEFYLTHGWRITHRDADSSYLVPSHP